LRLPPEKASINLASIPNQYNELPHLASISGQKTTTFQRIPFPFNGSIGSGLFRQKCHFLKDRFRTEQIAGVSLLAHRA
jgi:hypothetical protein